MPSIELDRNDVALLREVLDSTLSDLRLEVAATDSKEMRDRLKAREQALKALLDRLSAAG